MSTLTTIPPIVGTDLVPPDNPFTAAGPVTLTPGMSTSDEESPLSSIENWLTSTTGSPMRGSSAYAPRTLPSLSNLTSWIGTRGAIAILGFMLIAAGIFTHPAVREKIVAAGKKAGELAAVA